MKQKLNGKHCLILAGVLIFSIVLLVAALYILRHQSPAGEKRQEIEESLAEEYLYQLQVEEASLEEVESEESSLEVEESDQGTTNEVQDDAYLNRDGVTYTPDYALGHLDYVLTIPSIGLKRGVYTGTTEEIQHDLDIWMTVTARPDYTLSKTQYVIYGHNHPEQDLSFNRLQQVQVGEYFTLTGEDGVHLYLVTDFFAEWREIVTWDYADNFNLSPDQVYIVTCGRGEYRYKDIVVVGTEQGVYSLDTWTENQEAILNELYNIEIETEEVKDIVKEPLHFDVKSIEEADKSISVQIAARDASETAVNQVTLALFDEDGIIISLNEEKLRWTQNGDVKTISNLPAGKYLLAVMETNGEFAAPEDQILTITKTEIKQEAVSTEVLDEKLPKILPVIVIILGALYLSLAIYLIIVGIKRLQKNS